MNITIRQAKTKEDYNLSLEIRRKVFIEEQSVPENIEIEFEDKAIHFIAFVDNLPVATSRWRRTTQGIKLERFAVLKDFRKMSIGSKMFQVILSDISNEKMIYLHSQENVIEFYRKLGFKESGDKFIEADIIHQKMYYSP